MSTSVPGSSSSGQDTTDQSQVDVLNEGADDSSDDTVVSDETTDEGETEEESTTETPSKTSDEEEDEGESEAEIEGDEELEELDETQEPTRPSWQIIKEKYPELAKSKDFRELYFRDKAYTEVFPTVSDAKDAASKAEQLEVLDQVLVEGNVDTIFSNLNEDVLLKISDRLLPSLYKINKSAFSRAARPLIIDVMHNIMEQATRTNDDNLKKSIRNVSRALTGNPDLPARVSATTDPTINEEVNRLKSEKDHLVRVQERNFLAATDRAVTRKLETIVSDGLDPKGELNSFTKQAIIEKTLSDLRTKLLSDESLKGRVQQLHKLAVRSGFADEYKSRIISASLERARKLVPLLRNKHKMAALGKQSTKSNTSTKIVTKNETVTTEGRGASTSGGKIDMKKTSPEDFLNDKITFKK